MLQGHLVRETALYNRAAALSDGLAIMMLIPDRGPASLEPDEKGCETGRLLARDNRDKTYTPRTNKALEKPPQ